MSAIALVLLYVRVVWIRLPELKMNFGFANLNYPQSCHLAPMRQLQSPEVLVLGLLVFHQTLARALGSFRWSEPSKAVLVPQ
jgi:hypothetical protein